MVFTLDALNNFANFMIWSLFLRKPQALRLANLLKRNSNTGIFLENWQDFQEHFVLNFFKLFLTSPVTGF